MKLTVFAPAHLLDGLSACLFDAGAGCLEEGACRLSLYAESGEELRRLQSVAEEFSARISEFDSDADIRIELEETSNDWQNTWLEALEPAQVTPTWTLRPLHKSPAPAGEHTIWYKPEASFGEGAHPTTRLAAEKIESLARQGLADDLFDVGTGTGVLSLIAAKEGASNILAVDIDPVSVAAAQQNAKENGLEAAIEIAEGSADFSRKPRGLVMANINTPILHALSSDLCGALTPGGLLLLTGLLEEDIQELQTNFASHGVSLEREGSMQGWALLSGRRS